MKLKAILAGAVAAATLIGVGACGNTGGTGSTGTNGKTTLSLWENSTTGPGMQYWKDFAKTFEAKYPQYEVKIQAIQDNDLDTKLQTGLQDQKSGPNIFLARGGKKLQAMVNAGQVLDLSDVLSAQTKTNLGGAISVDAFDNKPYAVPVDLNPEGFWYNKDMWAKAGLKDTPKTLDELEKDVAILRAKLPNVAPIALGGKGGWPAAHYWYQFAMLTCPSDVYAASKKSDDFSNPCYTQAGVSLANFLKNIKGFQPGWETTEAQQGAGSSAGLIATQKAAMELMGSWDPGVIASFTKNAKVTPKWLGYFPFPSIPGGADGVMMSGADGYACTAWTDKKACGDFFDLLMSQENQENYYKAFQAIPVVTAAQSAVTTPCLKDAAAALSNAKVVNQFMDTDFGATFSTTANQAMVDFIKSVTTNPGMSAKDIKAGAAKVAQAATTAAKQG